MRAVSVTRLVKRADKQSAGYRSIRIHCPCWSTARHVGRAHVIHALDRQGLLHGRSFLVASSLPPVPTIYVGMMIRPTTPRPGSADAAMTPEFGSAINQSHRAADYRQFVDVKEPVVGHGHDH